MALRMVQKFGGTSVGSLERIQAVAKRIVSQKIQDPKVQIIVVSSAMSGETDRLVELVKSLCAEPSSREWDLVLASGEQVAVGLLSLAMNQEIKKRKLSCEARPFLAYQLGIRTDSVISKAKIQTIDVPFLEKILEENVIPVVAGFQGVDADNNLTTLGRGGTDTSAVAIAAAMKADLCEIYTDVDGVYSSDPRICDAAGLIQKVSYEDMMELASTGAKVLHTRSVELAAKYQVPLTVRSSFNEKEGTQVVSKEKLGADLEKMPVVGVTSQRGQAKLTIRKLPNDPKAPASVFSLLSENGISVDIIVMNVTVENFITLSFSIDENDAEQALRVLNNLKREQFSELEYALEKGLSKVSVVGVGMQHQKGVASTLFKILADQKISINLVTTSEIKICCLVSESVEKTAVCSLHEGFGLGVR